MRTAAILLVLYGAVVLAAGASHFEATGEFDRPARVALRLFGVGLLTYGLWSEQAWARWGAMAFGGIFGALGALGLWLGFQGGLFEELPVLNFALLVGSLGLLFGVAAVLAVARPKQA